MTFDLGFLVFEDSGVCVWTCALIYPADYPNNSQFTLFFKEFVTFGYRSSTDAIVVKFPWADGSRNLELWSVGISDGFTKIILMLSVVAIAWELELTGPEVDQLKGTFSSFKFVRCTYEHFVHPGHHFLKSLRTLALCGWRSCGCN